MKKTKRRLLPLIFLITILLLTVIGGAVTANLSGRETPLNPDGYVYEVFRDDSGELWISDYFVDEIWRVNPTSGAYTIYSDLVGASDGRTGGDGLLWWTD